jgi:hypothetical protein
VPGDQYLDVTVLWSCSPEIALESVKQGLWNLLIRGQGPMELHDGQARIAQAGWDAVQRKAPTDGQRARLDFEELD